DPVRVIMQPGTKCKYSGGGTTIVQLLIEDITGEKFDDWMQTNVLNPLGMLESTFSQPFSPTQADLAAYGHVKDGKVEGHWHIYPEKAAAGLWSTPADLAKFLIHIQSTLKTNKALLLHPTFVREMITRQLPLGDEDEPGLGFFISRDGDDLVFAHGGHDEGFIASFYGFASRDQGAVIMMNNDTGWGLMGEIKNSIADIYGWPDFSPVKKACVPLDGSILSDFQGNFVYRDDADKEIDEEIEITIIGNKPFVHFKKGIISLKYGRPQPVELFPENDYVYFIQEANVSIEFVTSPSKAIEALILIHPDKERTRFQRTTKGVLSGALEK
ncbi:MAG: beta-lactamase family protein, partial [Chlamydiae bacterium]|nr:beta-lactamase family protein [Chlamydiota bacterium]